MKKNRNTFFTESSAQAGLMPNNNMANFPGPNMVPYQSASSYMYNGPTPNMAPNNYNIDGNDIESRLAKIERQINRLDHRINKLENNVNIYTTEDIESTTTNMYMV